MHPIEKLTIDYIQSVTGDYEQVEPQVYDIVLPHSLAQQLQLPPSQELYRVTFEPEALADHPQAQLLAFGHPTLDEIFSMAHQQGSVGQIFLSGYNLQPHQLLLKLKQQLRIHKDFIMEFGRPRILNFNSWFYWFQATFACDEKTQHIFEVGIDQYYGRVARRLQELLESIQITSVPILPYPDIGGMVLTDAYLVARSEVVSKLRPLIRNYKETLAVHLSQESGQVTKYFDGMVGEIEERQQKSTDDALQQQKRSLQLEKQMRLVELQKKMTLKIELKLLNMLSVVMPKIITPLRLTSKRKTTFDLMVVWNPLNEAVEPVVCPQCHHPTLDLIPTHNGAAIQCTHCLTSQKVMARTL